MGESTDASVVMLVEGLPKILVICCYILLCFIILSESGKNNNLWAAKKEGEWRQRGSGRHI